MLNISTQTIQFPYTQAIQNSKVKEGFAINKMVRVSYEQKPYQWALIESYGANVAASPSAETDAGQAILEKDPNTTGSLGIAISEAVELATKNGDTKYALGSVLNYVLMHQTVIGLESIKQLEMAGDYPDVIVGFTGGESNFAGMAFPFIGQKLRGEDAPRIIAVEPAACPSLTKGNTLTILATLRT